MADHPEIVNVVFVDRDEGTEAVLGQFGVGPDGALTVVQAEPESEDFLDGLADGLNGQDSVSIKVPGKQRYALASQTFDRGQPDFFDGLKAYLERLYSIELRSSADAARNPEDFQGL